MWVADLGEEMRVAVVEAQKVAAAALHMHVLLIAHDVPPCTYTAQKSTAHGYEEDVCFLVGHVTADMQCVWTAGGREGAAG